VRQLDYEHAPYRERMVVEQDYWDGPNTNKGWSHLENMIRKNVGRPWNKIKSQILSKKWPRHISIGIHYILSRFVKENCMYIDGEYYTDRGYRLWSEFYVDNYGILRYSQPKKRPKKSKEITWVLKNDYTGLIKVDGVWWFLRFEAITDKWDCRDAYLRPKYDKIFSKDWNHYYNTNLRQYGYAIYCKSKTIASNKQLEKEGLL